MSLKGKGTADRKNETLRSVSLKKRRNLRRKACPFGKGSWLPDAKIPFLRKRKTTQGEASSLAQHGKSMVAVTKTFLPAKKTANHKGKDVIMLSEKAHPSSGAEEEGEGQSLPRE